MLPLPTERSLSLVVLCRNEAEHIEVSKQMAEASLLPAIRKAPDSWVVADGTSCRHQIADGAQRDAVHIARILAAHL